MGRSVLFTGSRDWVDEGPVREVLGNLSRDLVVVHGGAPGLDSVVDRLARQLGFVVRSYRAEWDRLGRRAGPVRNQRMLDEESPVACFAFPLPGSVGTWDMAERCGDAGVPVLVVRSGSRRSGRGT